MKRQARRESKRAAGRKSGVTRRTFLKASAAGASLLILPRRAFGANEKLNVACVGVGGRGGAAVGGCSRERVVALCDVDEKRAGGNFKKYSSIPHYKDYRRMLDEKGKEIDAVTVSTPDHVHFPVAYAAMQMGKHVCVEKPLVNLYSQAMKLIEAEKEYGLATQMGNQGQCSDGPRVLREWVQAGILGEVRRIDAWTNRPVWPQGMTKLLPAEPVRDGLDWRLWLGGAADYEYNGGYCPFKWRGWYAFGTGAIGDFFCHNVTAAYYALDLDMPTSVYAETSGTSEVAFPRWSVVKMQFPARGAMPPVTVTWYDGNKKPEPPEGYGEKRKMGHTGAFIYGEKAAVWNNSHSTSVRIVPESRMKELQDSLPPKTIPRIRGGHFGNWIAACKDGGKTKTGSAFSYAARLTGAALLVAIAQRLPGRELRWDDDRKRFTNDGRANRLLEEALPKA